MAKYQKQHYEDVARILNVFQTDEPHDLHECITCEVVEAITDSFTNLFATDNPDTCRICGAPNGESLVCAASKTSHHDFTGGFNRAQFLSAWGLDTETWPNASGDCSGSATCIDHPESAD